MAILSTSSLFSYPSRTLQELVQYLIADLPFQRKDSDVCIIVSLYNDLIQRFTDSWNIIATGASKSSSMVAIAECTATTQFSYRIHPVNSIFTAEALAIGTDLDELTSLIHRILLLTTAYQCLWSSSQCPSSRPGYLVVLS